jgi:isocitrate/isopropylmalate dehydrogenase
MRHYRVCMLSGTGLGPELSAHTHEALEALGYLHGFRLDLEFAPYGAEGLHRHGSLLPEETVARCREADAVWVGDSSSPAFAALLAALPAPRLRGLQLGPLGPWLDEKESEYAHLHDAQTPVVALVADSEPHLASHGVADPWRALAATCLLLEALGEHQAAATLARTLHLHVRDPAQSPQERVRAVVSELEARRFDVEFAEVASA